MPSEKPEKTGVTPTISSPDCDKHVAWIKTVFDAQVDETYRTKDGEAVMHCSLLVNGGYLYLYDSSTEMAAEKCEPREAGEESRGVVLHVELEEPKAFWKTALDNGATVVEDLKQQYFGAVYGSVRDPFGFVWGLMKGGECRRAGVVPYLVLAEGQCGPYLEWLEKTLGAEVKDKFLSADSGLVEHCSVAINGGMIYVADNVKMVEHREGTKGGERTTSNVTLHMDVADPKATWGKLLEEEQSKILVDLKVQFWGDLFGVVRDGTGYQWSLCSKPADTTTTTGGGGKGGVVSHLLSPDCEKHVRWIEKVLGGEVREMRHTEAGNKIMHCIMRVNGGTLMLADRNQDAEKGGGASDQDATPTTANEKNGAEPKEERGLVLHLDVPDPQPIWERALGNGGVQVMELKKQFWGGTYGQFLDPFGYQWGLLKS